MKYSLLAMERFWKMNQQADEMHRMWDEEDEEEELRMKGRSTRISSRRMMILT